MTRGEFRRYRYAFQDAQRAVLSQGGSPTLSEAAFPAYATSSAPARFLFWERVRRVTSHLGARPAPGSVLDFGCGGGVMLPFLGRIARRVVAMDVNLEPLRTMRARIDFPTNLEVHDARLHPLDRFPAGSFDTVLALDVLEHVPDLDGTLRNLHRLLAPHGELVISGPTENLAYRIGRRLSGPAYSGDYHVRNVYDIRRAALRIMPVETLATLYPPVPLFRIYRCYRDG